MNCILIDEKYSNVSTTFQLLCNCKDFLIEMNKNFVTNHKYKQFLEFFKNICCRQITTSNMIKIKSDKFKQEKCIDTFLDFINNIDKAYLKKVTVVIETNITNKQDPLYKAHNYIEESYNKEFSFIKPLFYGLYYNSYKCRECFYESNSFQEFKYITDTEWYSNCDMFCKGCHFTTLHTFFQKIIIAPKYIILSNNILNFNLSNEMFFKKETYNLLHIIYKTDIYYITSFINNKWRMFKNGSAKTIDYIDHDNCVFTVYVKSS